MRVQIHAILQRDFQNTAYRRCEMNGFYKLSAEIIASLARCNSRHLASIHSICIFTTVLPSNAIELLVLIVPSSSSLSFLFFSFISLFHSTWKRRQLRR